MPLFYVARQSQKETKEGVKLYHLVLKKVGKVVDTQAMATEIAEKSSLTEGDVHNVVRNLMSVMRGHLLNSQSVRLDGLGTFTMKASSKGKGVMTPEEVNPNQVTALKCLFTPEYKRPAAIGTTRALLQGVEFQRWDENLSAGTAGDEEEDEDESGSQKPGEDGGDDQSGSPL